MKVLVGITFDTIDSLGAKKQIRKGVWCSPEVVTPNPNPQHRSEAAGADNPGIMRLTTGLAYCKLLFCKGYGGRHRLKTALGGA